MMGQLVLALSIAVMAAFPGSAQSDLNALIAQGGGTTAQIPPSGSTGRVDLDRPTLIIGDAGNMPVMSAPNDEAILVVHPGAELRLSDVTLRKAGAETFGIYINGGTLELNNCRIEGDFDTAIYLASGSAIIRNCVISDVFGSAVAAQAGSQLVVMDTEMHRATEVMVYVDGAEVRLERVSITDGGGNAIYMQNDAKLTAADIDINSTNSSVLMALVAGVEARIQGLDMQSPSGNGLLIENAPNVDLSDITATGDMSGGIIIDGAENFTLTGFRLDTANAALQVSNISGEANITDGRVTPRSDGYGAIIGNLSFAEISFVNVSGGELGLLLEGSLPELAIADTVLTGQSLYAVAMQDIAATEGASGIVFDRLHTAGTGEALGFFTKNAPPFDLLNSRLAVTGPLLGYVENAALGRMDDTVLALAAETSERTVVLTDLQGTRDRVFLSDGFTAPVQGVDALPQGVMVSSLTNLIENAIDRDTQFAIADFALGGDLTSTPDLFLEMDMALLPEPEGPAKFTVSLAPPADGVAWLPDALDITLTPPTGSPLFLRPSDFPVQVTPGLYQLSISGINADVISIQNDLEINIPELPHPFLISRDEDGNAWRGPYLILRGPDVLARISQGQRPLRIGEYLDNKAYFIARGNVDQNLVSETLTKARAELADIISRRDGLDQEAHQFERDRLWNMQRMYLEILAEYGTAEDVKWILTEFQGDSLTYNMVQTVVRLETRLGIINDGTVMAHISARQDQGDVSSSTNWLIDAAARTGAPAALNSLALQRQRLLDETSNTEVQNYGIPALALAGPETALPIYRAYLKRLDQTGAMYLNGTELDYSALGDPSTWRNVALVLSYLARHGDTEDLALFHVPIPGVADINQLLPIARDPAFVLDTYISGVPEADPATRMWWWSEWFGTRMCLAFTQRTPNERAEIAEEMGAVTRLGYLGAFVSDYWERDSMERTSIERSIAFGLGLSGAHCRLHPNVVDLAMGEAAEGEERRKFEFNNYDPDWWQRPVRARAEMATLATLDDWVRLDGLSHYSTEQLLAWLDEAGGAADPALVDVWERHHRLLTDAFVSPQWHTSFQSERRVFRLRNLDGNGTQSIAGHVDMRLFPNGDVLTVAIGHNIQTPDFGGLAALIDEPNRTPYEVDSRRRMFETVTLEQNGTAVPMEYLETNAAGVHFFRAPFNGNFSNSYIRIGMRFVDTTWQLDYSLFDSHFATALRSAGQTAGGTQ